jgi:hypothetical protein
MSYDTPAPEQEEPEEPQTTDDDLIDEDGVPTSDALPESSPPGEQGPVP